MTARFVRLGIAGFKSFADATSLEILPGLTGVVGPNGCGKSNVAEALRWAMGEANARNLRGGEMDDVIFAGSANRPSRNLAEVSVAIEDDGESEDGGALPAPFTNTRELQVVRRLERGVGSAYRVNGRETRARDVQTLFADMASGARSSAMVSQGRVGALVNARPEDRRAVLEEAAGITGLHARRGEAETRLRAAEGNLELAEERRTALERQLEGLRVQARQAVRYRTVMTAALEAEAALLGLQQGRARAACTAAETALAAAADAVQAATVASIQRGEAAERLQAGLPGLRNAEAGARTLAERAQVAREGLVAEAARGEAAQQAAEQRRAQIGRDLGHARAGLQDAERAEARLDMEMDRLRAEAAGYPALLEAARVEAAAAAAALREADQVAQAAQAAAAEAGARSSAIQQVLQQAEQRARRARDVAGRLAAERAAAAARAVDPARLEAVLAEMAGAERRLLQVRGELERAETERGEAAAAMAAARETLAGLDAGRHRLGAETSALREVLEVKDGERWPPMLDRLSVPPGLEAALGAVLGEELAAAENPGAARHWRALPPMQGSEEVGRALPPMQGSEEVGRALPALVAGKLPGRALAEMVRGPAVLGRALAGIGLVQSEAEGDAGQASLRPGQALVTVDGAVWRWDGYTVRAGTRTAAAVRLQQRNRLVALRTQLAEAEAACLAARAACEEARRRDEAARVADQQARAGVREAQAEAERARSAGQSLQAQAAAAAGRLLALDEQISTLAPELEAAGEALAAATRERAAQADPGALLAAAEQCRGSVGRARTRDVVAIRSLDGLQRAEQGRQVRLGSIEQERAERRARMTDLRGQVADLVARAEEAGADVRRLADQPGRTAREVETAEGVFREARAAQAAAAAAREAGERRAVEASAEARGAEHAVFAAREGLARAEMAEVAAGQVLMEVEGRVAERAGALPALVVPAELSAASEERARGRLQRLVRERDEMGPVNLRAEMEAGAIETDMAEIVRERDELGTAIAKLRGSIGHLNREGREKLTAVFQQVDRQFQALFTRMFGGGRAHLALVGSEDPLLAGLEIYAQPPGKKLSMLSLLSGGEQALTALSLIFAVFRCNPAPLCVLDEVDAPLDDANVERLCSLLADMARESGTRFLVVTHHQVTMARMDRLYGVTMQERGVSRLLSVDLSSAVGMVEAMAAE